MNFLKRFSIAVLFALVVTSATYLMARANAEAKSPAFQQPTNKCAGCHAGIFDEWTLGKHSHATSDPLFTQMWTDQGKPGACLVCHVTGYDPAAGTWQEDGVSCEACHAV